MVYSHNGPVVVEKRIQRRLSTLAQGLDLVGHDLNLIVYAGVDGMIGHLNLFIAGFLHRDPSVGNVLIDLSSGVRTDEQILNHDCVRLDKFEFLKTTGHLKRCYGYLIDGDLAIRWKDQHEAPRHRSGTLPFMSHRLLESWDSRHLHTAIDDLESFVWIVLWSALRTIRSPTSRELDWLTRISDDDVQAVANQKMSIMILISKPTELSPELEPFHPLFKRWFAIALDAQDKLDELIASATIKAVPTIDLDTLLRDKAKSVHFIQEVEELCFGYYQQYLKGGTEFLQGRGMYGDLEKA